jgi:hypothetical protein
VIHHGHDRSCTIDFPYVNRLAGGAARPLRVDANKAIAYIKRERREDTHRELAEQLPFRLAAFSTCSTLIITTVTCEGLQG